MASMRNRLRMYGARLNRFTIRLAIFVGMMGLYSLALGSTDWHLLSGGLLVAALTAGLVILWVTSRKQRKLDRSHQLAAEVRMLYPGFPAEELDRAYTRRRRREMRLEALWYLLFAVLSALWFWVLYATDASPLTWVLGVRTVLPALVLISAGLLVGSFLPVAAKDRMPLISQEETRATLQEASGLHIREDETSSVSLYHTEKDMTPEEYIREERKDLRSTVLFLLFAFAFFAGLPIVMLVMALIDHFYQTLLIFIAVIGVTVWIIMCAVSHSGPLAVIAMLIQLNRMRTGKCRAYRDELVSHAYGEEEGILELNLARTGTIKVRCQPQMYANHFAEPKKAAMVQTMGDRVERIELMPGAAYMPDAAGAAKKPAPAKVGRDDEQLLDEAYCRQEALRKIEGMASEQRQALEAEIESRFDVLDSLSGKGFSNLSTVEQNEIMAASSAEMHRLQPDPELGGIETALTEKLGITRVEILRMEKNPFVPVLVRRLILAAAVGLCGNLGTALAERSTGAELGFAYLAFSSFAGYLALRCGEAVVNVLRFRKLQKAYRDPQYRRKLLDAAVYQELRSQVERRRAGEKQE